jgi:hypothetical protein
MHPFRLPPRLLLPSKHHSGFQAEPKFVLGVTVRHSRIFAELYCLGFSTAITTTLTRTPEIMFPIQRPGLIPLPLLQLLLVGTRTRPPEL